MCIQSVTQINVIHRCRKSLVGKNAYTHTSTHICTSNLWSVNNDFSARVVNSSSHPKKKKKKLHQLQQFFSRKPLHRYMYCYKDKQHNKHRHYQHQAKDRRNAQKISFFAQFLDLCTRNGMGLHVCEVQKKCNTCMMEDNYVPGVINM